MQIGKSISDGRDALLEFIFPSCCLICDSYIDKPGELVCPDCWNKVDTFGQILCGSCELPLSDKLICANCTKVDPFSIVALGQFAKPLDEMIRYFKYRKYSNLGTELANRLIDIHSETLEKMKIDVIIPVPLHSYRLKMRGYNQSAILADIIGKRLNRPVVENTLLKIKHNKYQKSLDLAHRENNVSEVYRVIGEGIEGKRILIVDDVITTGATLREVRRVLANAGGKVIAAAVIAVTGR